MAADKPIKPTSAPQIDPNDLVALAGRLEGHADGIEMISLRAMKEDMTRGAAAIDRLIAGIRKAAAETTDAATQRALASLLGDPAEPK